MNWQKTRSDLVLTFSAQVAYKLLGFVVLALLTRYLAKEHFGGLMFALSLCGVFVLFTEFGTSTWLVREVASQPQAALQRTAQIILLRMPLIAAYLAAVNLLAYATKPKLIYIVLPISVYVALRDLNRSYMSLFLGLGHPVYTVVAFATGLVLQALGILIVVLADAGLAAVLACYIASGIVIVVMGWQITRRRIGVMPLRREPGVARTVIRQSFPLFALAGLTLLHFSADTLMLGYMKPITEVARYEAPARLLEASQFLMRPISLIFFPICAQIAARQQWAQLEKLLVRLLVLAGGVGAMIAAVVAVAAGLIMPIVFGAEYHDAAPVLRVLYLSVPTLYITMVCTFFATSMHREGSALRTMALGVGLNVLLNLYVIPAYGAVGAAWTTVSTQALIAVLMTATALRNVGRQQRLDESVILEQAEAPA